MKFRKITLTVLSLLLILAPAAFAEKAEVKVNGMVCSFCAQGIKKKFSEHPSVESCEVNLDDKKVELNFKKGKKMSDDEIRTTIKDAGYTVERLQRFN